MALGNAVLEVLEGSLKSVLEALPRVGRRQAAKQRIETVGDRCLELSHVGRAVDPDQVVVEAKKEFGRVRCDDAGPESLSCWQAIATIERPELAEDVVTSRSVRPLASWSVPHVPWPK